jgi:hypothetical protein
LKRLKLTEDEWNTITACSNSGGITVIENKIKTFSAEVEQISARRPNLSKKSGVFCNKFCDFAVRTSGIITPFTQLNKEFALAYGLLSILFDAVVTKKEREESLLESIEFVGGLLPVVEFYKTIFPTNAMKDTVATLYVEIMNFLDEALIYYRSGRLGECLQ